MQKLNFKTFALLLLLAASLGLVVTGCGNSRDFVVTNSNNTVAVTTGSVVINNTLARALPTNITSLTFRGRKNGVQVFLAENQPRVAQTVLTGVPLDIDAFVMELYVGTTLVGTYTDSNPTFVNGVYTINDPAWTTVLPTLNNATLNATYRLHGAGVSDGNKKGAVWGQLVFNGAGGITSGSLTVQDVFFTPVTFNVSSTSTYTVSSNGNFTANLNTNSYALTLTGRVSNDAKGVWATVLGNDGTMFGSTSAMLLDIQSAPTGGTFTNSSLNATYNASLGYIAQDNFVDSDPPGCYEGTFVFKGDGTIGASTFVANEASVPDISVTSGTYSVASDGRVTGEVVFGNALATQKFVGQIGPDGTFSFASNTNGAAAANQFFATCSVAPTGFTAADVSSDFYVMAINLTSAAAVPPGVISGAMSAPSGTVTPTTLVYNTGNMPTDVSVSGTLKVDPAMAQLTNSSLNISFTDPIGMMTVNGTLGVKGFTFNSGAGGFGGLCDQGTVSTNSGFGAGEAIDMFGVVLK